MTNNNKKNASSNKDLVAVITRTKNRPLLLERCLKSVKSQTFTNFVHVIVNDGGDQKEVDRLVKEEGIKNTKIIHNKKSVGLTKALNLGITAVDTAYISILDDDDTWAPDKLETVMGYVEEYKPQGVIDTMDRIIEEIKGNKIILKQRDRWYPDLKAVSLYKQCLDNYLSNGCFTYTREMYDKLNGYDESLVTGEDWDFGIRFLLECDVDVLETEQALSFYHHRPEQEGVSGNSVFARRDEQIRQLNLLRNHYLRQDLAAGRVGIGYIMNQVLQDRYRDDEMQQKLLGYTERLEDSINRGVHEVIKSRISRKIKNIIFRNK